MRRRRLLALPVALAVPLLVAGPAAARSYRAYDLGEFQPYAVNVKNQVAGDELAPRPGGGVERIAAVWSGGGLRRLLPTLGSSADSPRAARDIADNGTVVGSVTTDTASTPDRGQPVVWIAGVGPAVPVASASIIFGMTGISPSGAIAVGSNLVLGQPQTSIRATIAGGTVTPAGFPGASSLRDANDAGDLVGFDASGAAKLFRGGSAIALDTIEAAHPLGADGSVLMQDQPATWEILIRRQDGTIVRTGAFRSASATEPNHSITARAVQNGAFVGDQMGGFGEPYLQRAVLWKSGRLIDLSPFVPPIAGRAPRTTQAVDLSPTGAIVGFSTQSIPGEATVATRGWLLVLQVKITGQVVEPSLPPASPARLATRAATRPVKGARVVLTPAGGTPITATTDAQGRFSADVPPGKVAITLPGRSGCVTAACATTTTIDAQDDLALAVRLDPTTKPAAPTLPKGAIRVKRGAVPLTLRCRLVSAPCRITATVRTKRKVLATAVVTVKAGRTAVRTLPLTKAGKAALAGGTAVKATLTLVTRTPTGRRLTATFGVRVRR